MRGVLISAGFTYKAHGQSSTQKHTSLGGICDLNKKADLAWLLIAHFVLKPLLVSQRSLLCPEHRERKM